MSPTSYEFWTKIHFNLVQKNNKVLLLSNSTYSTQILTELQCQCQICQHKQHSTNIQCNWSYLIFDAFLLLGITNRKGEGMTEHTSWFHYHLPYFGCLSPPGSKPPFTGIQILSSSSSYTTRCFCRFHCQLPFPLLRKFRLSPSKMWDTFPYLTHRCTCTKLIHLVCPSVL